MRESTHNRREQILSAAYEIVGREGLEGLHARTVAASLGINHAAVHYYYRTRSQLIAALAEHVIERFVTDQERILSTAETPGQRVGAHVALAESYTARADGFTGNLVSLMTAAIEDSEVRGLLSGHLSRWQSALKADLEGLGADGPLARPRVLCATLLGLMLISHLDSAPASPELSAIAQALVK